MNKNLDFIITQNFLMQKKIIKKMMLLILLVFVFLAGLNVPTYAKNLATGLQCSPRYIAQNIQAAVLALKATQYCSGVDLPYSVAQASMRVDELRCGVEASNLLDNLIGDYDGQYKSILSGEGKQVACKKAASLNF